MTPSERNTFKMLIQTATMATLCGESDPVKAAEIIAEHVADILDTADKEIQAKFNGIHAELAEKNKIIAGLIKSNDEYADALRANAV
jgi:hypothetical protein